jgi:putative methionine-R-sulfoxide reductase with GAF domain
VDERLRLDGYHPPMTVQQRDYSAIASHLEPTRDRQHAMQTVANALWNALGDLGVSWCGFYIDQPDEQDDRRLVLGPHRDKPACSPIGLHGACGQALLARRTLIVRDVSELGERYIACDPRDRSEIVVPLIDNADRCWGVLDVDSFEIGAFDASDDVGLRDVLRAIGFRPA